MPIDFPFRIDPTGRTASPADERALIRGMVEQVLLTSPGERVARPSFGTALRQLVFAGARDEMATATAHLVESALQRWMAAWIQVVSVEVRGEAPELRVTVSYIARASGERDAVDVGVAL